MSVSCKKVSEAFVGMLNSIIEHQDDLELSNADICTIEGQVRSTIVDLFPVQFSRSIWDRKLNQLTKGK